MNNQELSINFIKITLNEQKSSEGIEWDLTKSK